MTKRQRERLARFGPPHGPKAQANAPAPLTSPLIAAPTQQPPIVEESPDTVVVRTASVSMMIPRQVWNGRLQHPDPVLLQPGGPRTVARYRIMLQQDLSLAADCTQWEDRVNAINCRVRAGKAGDDTSEKLAAQYRSIFRRIPYTPIVNTWIIRSRWYGVTSIGMAGWITDPETGLRAPFDLYNIDPWRWKFGPNMEPFLITDDSWNGVTIPPRSVFFSRWGSNFTAYGEAVLRDVYLSCWTTQNVEELLLQNLEIFGRPVPWIEIGDTIPNEDEYKKFEQGISKQYKHYVITRTPGAPVSTAFPNQNVIANGAAGKSETDLLRYLNGLKSRFILGTQQAQDKTGGVGAIEDVRLSIAEDKTPPGVLMRDQVWTSGYFDCIGLVNHPNIPRELWPIMDSDASDIGAEQLKGPQVDAIAKIAEQIRLRQISNAWAIGQLVKLSFSRTEAEAMVASMLAIDSGVQIVTGSPIATFDGSRIQQVLEAISRYTSKSVTKETSFRLMTAAGMPEEWAIAIIDSTEKERGSLSPAQRSSGFAPPPQQES